MTPDRADALNKIAQIAQTHGLTTKDIALALADDNDTAPSGGLQRALIYIGAAFIFCGIGTYCSMIWDDIGSFARVTITLGTGLVAFFLGLAALADPRFKRAATPLFTIAAALEPVGLFVFMHEYLPPSSDAALASCFVFGFMTLQQGLALTGLRRPGLMFFTLFFLYAFLSAAMAKINLPAQLYVFAIGVSMLAAATHIQKRTSFSVITPFYFFIGGLMTACVTFDYLEETRLDILLIGVCALMVMLSVYAASRTLLFVSILSLLAFLIYFTDEYFKDVTGWPLALVFIGLMMIAVSSAAIRLGRRMKTRTG